MGVGSGNGYSRARRTAMKRRFPYVRDIIRALGDPGGFFSEAASPEPWLARGDVDVVFLVSEAICFGRQSLMNE
ncbi:hypothetical protein GCM10025778_31150 [Paeniglutamicibacter antarcticus]|uniref:Uncharacterized protein n=1 Tax=Paeniglutamicibacter antarcticus TaxID=494023 RepID=A0ABP9TSA9_9MICC